MVSKARDDLPDPLTPVMTISRLCGSVTSMFLRLCVRAPRTTIGLRVGLSAWTVSLMARVGFCGAWWKPTSYYGRAVLGRGRHQLV
jgi:hypothetical protein